jgi:hypothetical protein
VIFERQLLVVLRPTQRPHATPRTPRYFSVDDSPSTPDFQKVQ